MGGWLEGFFSDGLDDGCLVGTEGFGLVAAWAVGLASVGWMAELVGWTASCVGWTLGCSSWAGRASLAATGAGVAGGNIVGAVAIGSGPSLTGPEGGVRSVPKSFCVAGVSVGRPVDRGQRCGASPMPIAAADEEPSSH